MIRLLTRIAPFSLAILLTSCANTPTKPVEINLAVINDLHGYLQGTEQTYNDPSAPNGRRSIRSGGIDILAGVINDLRKNDPQLLVVGTGDLVGASPAMSSIWADEPTLLALNEIGLQLSSVGNHELDNGKSELLRLIQGGCDSNRPKQACKFENPYPGIRFPFLAANLVDSRTGKTLVPPYQILEAHGEKIAFVGAVLKNVAEVVSPSGMQGLEVLDEADAINALVPELENQDVAAIVAVIHQGGATQEAYDQPDCQHLQGPIVDIAKRLDPAVDMIASAHTHQAYTCRVDGRPVFQGGSYGQFVSHVQLEIDPRENRVIQVHMSNLIVDSKHYAADPNLKAFREDLEQRSRTLLDRPIARLGVPRISREANAAGETPLGDLVADAQLAAVHDRGAQIAFMNRGGLRNDLALEPGQTRVTHAQVASTLPFGNTLTLMSMSGAQLRGLLESQWRADGSTNLLQVSDGLRYQWDPQRPLGQRLVPGSLQLNGQPIRDTQTYRVVTNNFLAEGGDGFDLFVKARDKQDTGLIDLDMLEDYLADQDQSGTPAGRAEPAGRIQRY